MEQDPKKRPKTPAEMQQERLLNATYAAPTVGNGTPRDNPNVTMPKPPVVLGASAASAAAAASATGAAIPNKNEALNELKSSALSSELGSNQRAEGGEGYSGATAGDPSGLGAFKFYNPSTNRPSLPSTTTNFNDLRGMTASQASFFGDQRRAIRDAKAEADQYRFMARSQLSNMSPGRAARIAAGLADSVRDDAKLGSEFTGLGMKQLQERDLEAASLRQKAEGVQQQGILDANRIGTEYAMGRDKLSMEERLTGRKLGSEEKVATLGALKETSVARNKSVNDAIQFVLDQTKGRMASKEAKASYLLSMGVDKDEVANLLSKEQF